MPILPLSFHQKRGYQREDMGKIGTLIWTGCHSWALNLPKGCSATIFQSLVQCWQVQLAWRQCSIECSSDERCLFCIFPSTKKEGHQRNDGGKIGTLIWINHSRLNWTPLYEVSVLVFLLSSGLPKGCSVIFFQCLVQCLRAWLASRRYSVPHRRQSHSFWAGHKACPLQFPSLISLFTQSISKLQKALNVCDGGKIGTHISINFSLWIGLHCTRLIFWVFCSV